MGDDSPQISRRRMLTASALGGVAALATLATLGQKQNQDAQESMPRGTLAIIGGSVDLSARLGELARQLGIDETSVATPEGLSLITADQRELLRRECDHAGLFEAIDRHSPFREKPWCALPARRGRTRCVTQKLTKYPSGLWARPMW